MYCVYLGHDSFRGMNTPNKACGAGVSTWDTLTLMVSNERQHHQLYV
jgi:hypothetical protein